SESSQGGKTRRTRKGGNGGPQTTRSGRVGFEGRTRSPGEGRGRNGCEKGRRGKGNRGTKSDRIGRDACAGSGKITRLRSVYLGLAQAGTEDETWRRVFLGHYL